MLESAILVLGLGLGQLVPAAVPTIDEGLNGSWWNPAQDGQGLVVHVIPEANQIFVAWFTYEPSGGRQMWITGSGVLDQHPLQLELVRPSGGVLSEPEPAPALTPWGSATLEFSSCTGAKFSYQGEAQGELELERLTPVVNCSQGSAR